MHAPRAKAEEASNASAGARRNYKKPDESLVLRPRVAACVSAIYLLCHYLANAVRIITRHQNVTVAVETAFCSGNKVQPPYRI